MGKRTSASSRYVLRLFTAGMSLQSQRAIHNVKVLCETYLSGRYDLTVIDLAQRPEAAGAAQVIAAPTLVRELPLPMKRLIGDLSDENRVLLALDLAPPAGPPAPENRLPPKKPSWR